MGQRIKPEAAIAIKVMPVRRRLRVTTQPVTQLINAQQMSDHASPYVIKNPTNEANIRPK